jgi:hypothetical protein
MEIVCCGFKDLMKHINTRCGRSWNLFFGGGGVGVGVGSKSAYCKVDAIKCVWIKVMNYTVAISVSEMLMKAVHVNIRYK